MQQFQEVNWKQKDKMVIYPPDISKNFILNSAIRDATYILLRPYLVSSLPSSYHPNIHVYAQNEELVASKQEHTGKYPYFLTLMATIAWDFLDISNLFYCNGKQQQINGDS